MNPFRWSLLLPAVIMIGCNMSGCGVFNTEPFVDAKKDVHGEVILLDTPRMWRYWKADVARAIANEKAGVGPGGGVGSWNAQWLRTIEANEDRENAEKYISYAIDARRRAGLPELEGYQ